MPINTSLVMFKSDGTRRDFPVTREKIVVGRKNDCDLRIPLTSVSRKHCEFELADDQIKLRDLGSSNGTYHNNIRVQEAVLSAGDEIVIGPVVFTVVVDGQPEQIKPVRTILESENEGGSTPSPAYDQGQGESESPRGEPLHEADTQEPEHVEAEHSSPTVDLDDPVAGLGTIDQSEDENDASGSHVPFAGQGDDSANDDIQVLEDDENTASSHSDRGNQG